MRQRVAIALTLCASLPLASACNRKLTSDDCDRVLSRAVGLIAFPSAEVVPIDLPALRGRAKGEAKAAFASFDQICVGQTDLDVVNCARRAHDGKDFAACGPIQAKAAAAGVPIALVVARRHTADECSKYGEHAVKIGAATADEVGAVVTECDGTLEEGFYLCRMQAKDKDAWKKCE